MLKYYPNRKLSSLLSIPLSRWKRWSREFLPPDPLGGLQSGYARQYSVREAFTVYVAGYLVAEMGFSILEARKILQDLNGWLKVNIVPRLEDDRGTGGAGSIEILIAPAQGRVRPVFTYRIRSRVEPAVLVGSEPSLWRETYRETILKPGEPLLPSTYPACIRHLDLSGLVHRFGGCLKEISNAKTVN